MPPPPCPPRTPRPAASAWSLSTSFSARGEKSAVCTPFIRFPGHRLGYEPALSDENAGEQRLDGIVAHESDLNKLGPHGDPRRSSGATASPAGASAMQPRTAPGPGLHGGLIHVCQQDVLVQRRPTGEEGVPWRLVPFPISGNLEQMRPLCLDAASMSAGDGVRAAEQALGSGAVPRHRPRRWRCGAL